jgi:hypothetical protein
MKVFKSNSFQSRYPFQHPCKRCRDSDAGSVVTNSSSLTAGLQTISTGACFASCVTHMIMIDIPIHNIFINMIDIIPTRRVVLPILSQAVM